MRLGFLVCLFLVLGCTRNNPAFDLDAGGEGGSTTFADSATGAASRTTGDEQGDADGTGNSSDPSNPSDPSDPTLPQTSTTHGSGEETIGPGSSVGETSTTSEPATSDTGEPPPGDCCKPHNGLGCIDPATEDAVCGTAGYEYCCTDQWDQFCAARAVSLANGFCAHADATCCTPHGLKGCGNQDVMECVCAENPACCLVEWGPTCVMMAGRQCQLPCPITGGCCPGEMDANQLGCGSLEDATCVCIANDMPECCTEVWDALCAEAAAQLCPDACG